MKLNWSVCGIFQRHQSNMATKARRNTITYRLLSKAPTKSRPTQSRATKSRNRIRRPVTLFRRTARTKAAITRTACWRKATTVVLMDRKFSVFALVCSNNINGTRFWITIIKKCEWIKVMVIKFTPNPTLSLDPFPTFVLMPTKASISPTPTTHSFARRKITFKSRVMCSFMVTAFMWKRKRVLRRFELFTFTFMAWNWRHQRRQFASNNHSRIDRKSHSIRFCECFWCENDNRT